MKKPVVIYDACVLYPAPLRDLLMHIAVLDLCKARWTNQIHDEWIENLLLNRPDIPRTALERTRRLMDENVHDCLVTGYEPLIESLTLPDTDDRHVLAAAIHTKADLILTFNLKDFPAETLAQYGIEAQHPDLFVLNLLQTNPNDLCLAIRRQRTNLRTRPSVDQLLETLVEQKLVQTVDALRPYTALL